MAKDKELKNADSGQDTPDQDKPARKATVRRKDSTPTIEPIRTVEATTPEPVEAVETEKPKPENARWYAIHTYSGHEAKVSRNILLRADYEGLSHLIVRTFIPEEEEMRVVAGKTRKVKRKLFPGYVFIEMVLDDPTIQFGQKHHGRYRIFEQWQQTHFPQGKRSPPLGRPEGRQATAARGVREGRYRARHAGPVRGVYRQD